LIPEHDPRRISPPACSAQFPPAGTFEGGKKREHQELCPLKACSGGKLTASSSVFAAPRLNSGLIVLVHGLSPSPLVRLEQEGRKKK